MSNTNLGFPDELLRYIENHCSQESLFLKDIFQQNSNHPSSKMQISSYEGKVLSFLLKLFQPKKCLEIGVFMGYSTLLTALSIPDDGIIFALDINSEWTIEARLNWEKARVDHKINFILGDAVFEMEKLIPSHESTFDYIFIDADKKSYPKYFEYSLKLINPRGVIIIDNTLWKGLVVDEKSSSLAAKEMRSFNAMLAVDNRIEVIILPIADGLSIVRKIL